MRLFKRTIKPVETIREKPNFVIIAGCAGAGKTSLGKVLAEKLHWTYIDKDTVTRDFTDWTLVDRGKTAGDRESDVYCNIVRPLEYAVTFKLCDENLELGNSVILTIPLISQITDFTKWEDIVRKYNLHLENVNVKFIWITHNAEVEHTHLVARQAARDQWKLEHWDEYKESVEGIEPDERFEAYELDAYQASAYELYVKDVIEWIHGQ